MRDVCDFARYFIYKGTCCISDGEAGHDKLQKMLIFANLIHLARWDMLLFEEPVTTHQNGYAVEKIYTLYHSHQSPVKMESGYQETEFTKIEYDTMNDTITLFGKLPADELEELNRIFCFIERAEVHSSQMERSKAEPVIEPEILKREAARMTEVLEGLRRSRSHCSEAQSVAVSGVTFYFERDCISVDDQLLGQLEAFAEEAEDGAYTVYIDDGKLVIY